MFRRQEAQILDRSELSAYFLQGPGAFHFARWNRPLELAILAPSEATTRSYESSFGAALDRVCTWSGQSWRMQSGARPPNLVFVFVQKWVDLATLSMDLFGPLAIPNLINKMTESGATQFRTFSYGEDGSLASAFGFYNMSSRLRDYPTERIALAQSLLTHANFGPGALKAPIVTLEGVRWSPSDDFRQVLQAAYSIDTPASLRGDDGASHLYRSYAALRQVVPGPAPPADRSRS